MISSETDPLGGTNPTRVMQRDEAYVKVPSTGPVRSGQPVSKASGSDFSHGLPPEDL